MASEFTAEEEVLNHLTKVLPIIRVVYLWGPPGAGKTYLAIESLKELGLDNWIITLDEDRMVQELLGHYIPKGGEFVWHDGPVALAARSGGLIINELPRASGAVKDMLLSVLDNPASFSISLPTGENLKAHSKFCVVLTGNDSPVKAGLDPALVDRLSSVVELKYPTKGVVSYLNKRRATLGDAIYNSYTESNKSISPRKAIVMADLMDGGYNAHQACIMALGNTLGPSFLASWKSLYREKTEAEKEKQS